MSVRFPGPAPGRTGRWIPHRRRGCRWSVPYSCGPGRTWRQTARWPWRPPGHLSGGLQNGLAVSLGLLSGLHRGDQASIMVFVAHLSGGDILHLAQTAGKHGLQPASSTCPASRPGSHPAADHGAVQRSGGAALTSITAMPRLSRKSLMESSPHWAPAPG